MYLGYVLIACKLCKSVYFCLFCIVFLVYFITFLFVSCLLLFVCTYFYTNNNYCITDPNDASLSPSEAQIKLSGGPKMALDNLLKNTLISRNPTKNVKSQGHARRQSLGLLSCLFIYIYGMLVNLNTSKFHDYQDLKR